MRTNEQRINIIIGQLEAIKRKLQNEKSSCTDLIIQLKATKSALSSLLEKIVSEEIERCFVSQKKGKQEMALKIIKELTK